MRKTPCSSGAARQPTSGHVGVPSAVSLAACIASSVAWALLGWSGAAHAQSPSQQLPQLLSPGGCEGCKPVPAAADAPIPGSAPANAAANTEGGPVTSVVLLKVRFNGAQAIPEADLQTLSQPYLGRAVTLAQLEELAQAVTALYHERGYFLAQTVVPVQTIRDGVVELSVIEGRVGKVEINLAAEAPISEERVRGFLAALKEGQVVNAPEYERAMLLLSDQPGVRVGSSLQEGAAVGTTDLTVDVNPASRWSFTAEADNHGTKESGRFRVGGTARWASPLGIGDNLDLRAMLSNGNALQFGRLAYEAPLGTDGLRLGMGLAHVNYEVGGEFSVLGAQGSADVMDVSLSYPVIRQRRHNLYLRLSADTKRLKDEFRAVDFESRKRVNGVGVGWSWERRDDWLGGGYWASAGTFYHGNLSIRDELTRAADEALGGRRTSGSFSKLSFQLSRLQGVLPQHFVFASIGGQWASKNLDSSEKLALGGARAVRAYPSGEVLVDQGLIGTLEWRWAATSEFTPFLFFDAAHGRMSKDRLPLDTSEAKRNLRGAGVGVTFARAGDFYINATLAWRTGTRRPVTDGAHGGPRLFIQAQKSF